MKSLLFLSVLLTLNASAEMITRTKVQMGTFVTITLDEQYKKRLTPAFSIVDLVDKSLSSYNKNSPIYILNHDKHALLYSKLYSYTYEALVLSDNYYKKTDAYFNIAIGSITKDLYRFGDDERMPNTKELENSDVSFSALTFDENEAKITENIKIDLGGMGKGFAVCKVADYFRLHGVKKAKIAASGDIRCLGSCKIEINNPLDSKPLASFDTKEDDMGISTSGNYNRYVKSAKNNHLINPKTKRSQNNFISITLVSKLPSSDLDAYATAVSVMPKRKAFSFLDSLEVGYIVLDNQKDLVVSENIELYVNDLLIHDALKK